MFEKHVHQILAMHMLRRIPDEQRAATRVVAYHSLKMRAAGVNGGDGERNPAIKQRDCDRGGDLEFTHEPAVSFQPMPFNVVRCAIVADGRG